jgi:hypothetical protein
MDSSSTTTDMIKNLTKQMNDEFVGNALFVITIVIFIAAGVYLWYMLRLNARECSLMDSLYSTMDKYIISLNFSDPNCKYTLKDYYIKTAYNCCSGGSYKNDYVNTCVLKDLIKQGVRGLDFEIYSMGNQPTIATSTVESDYVKETYNSVPFADALSVITNYAFTGTTAPNPKDPILIHLRIKSTNQSMYKNFAKLLESYDGFLLGSEYSFENQGHNLGDAKLQDLAGKIIIIVERVNTTYMDVQEFYEYVNMTSASMFMRALPYYDVKFTPDLAELQEYNKKNMTIALPDAGSNPENPNGVICRETGCQMIAMRYQNFDANIQETISFFDKNGYAFVLKPEKLRFIPVTIPTPPPANPALSFKTRTVSSDYYNFNI